MLGKKRYCYFPFPAIVHHFWVFHFLSCSPRPHARTQIIWVCLLCKNSRHFQNLLYHSSKNLQKPSEGGWGLTNLCWGPVFNNLWAVGRAIILGLGLGLMRLKFNTKLNFKFRILLNFNNNPYSVNCTFIRPTTFMPPPQRCLSQRWKWNWCFLCMFDNLSWGLAFVKAMGSSISKAILNCWTSFGKKKRSPA